MLSRREFNLGAIGAALALSGCTPAEKTDVVIIGAGISGLNSARLLNEFGLSVLVLEAGARVGGRMNTIQTVDGPLDVGASQIGRSYARIIDACRRFELPLIPEDRGRLDFGMYFKEHWIDPKVWAENPLNRCVGDERAIPPMSMGRAMIQKYNPLTELDDWLDPEYSSWDISLRDLMLKNGHSDQAVELAKWTSPGISIDGTSVLRMCQEAVRSRYENRFSASNARSDPLNRYGQANEVPDDGSLARISNIEGGVQRLPEAMASALGDRVRLNQKVSSIEMQSTSATVRCADGAKYNARFVISAIPFSVLRGVRIDGSSNPIAKSAIEEMPYANTSRLYVNIDEPFWEQDGLPASFATDGPMGMFWTIDNHGADVPNRGMFVLVGESGQAITARSNPDEFLLEELYRLRPAAKGRIRKVAYKDWGADPLQKGCGFSLAPGQVNEFARDMLKPWDVLHFAGEHTRRMDYGMEAAMESSERVANEILVRA